MNLRRLGGIIAVAALIGGGVAADRVPVNAQAVVAQAPQGMSNRNLFYVRRRLEGLIAQLQNDRHDYGGHKATAIADLQQARQEIIAAIDWQRTHP